MKKVVINGRTRYIVTQLFTPNEKGWCGLRFLNKQEGFYNIKTGEIIDQIDGKYISSVGGFTEENLADIRFEDDSYRIFDCDRKLLLPYDFGHHYSLRWVWIIQTKPEAIQYLPSEYFCQGRHLRRADCHTREGFIELALNALKAERFNLSLSEFQEKLEKLNRIIEKKLEEEKDNIKAWNDAIEEERRIEAENTRIDNEKLNMINNAKKHFSEAE